MNKDNKSPHTDTDSQVQRKKNNDQAANSDTPGGNSVAGGGEDDSSTEIEGDDSHLHEDQKSRRMDV